MSLIDQYGGYYIIIALICYIILCATPNHPEYTTEKNVGYSLVWAVFWPFLILFLLGYAVARINGAPKSDV